MRYVAVLAHDFEGMRVIGELFYQQNFVSCLVPLKDWTLYAKTLQGAFAVVLDEADLRCDVKDDYLMDLEEYLLCGLHGPRILVLEKDGDHHVDVQVKGRTEIWTHQFGESIHGDFLYGFCHSSLRQYSEVAS